MRVTLTIVKGPGIGRVVEFTEPRGFVIGRAEDADLRLPEDDPYVSRRHVFLEVAPPNCRLRDLGTGGDGSTNAPHVNGDAVAETQLKNGDVLELGFTQFTVALVADAEVLRKACPSCGQPIEYLRDEAEPAHCPACGDRKERGAAPVTPAFQVACPSCGADLTARADSDGRAEALQARVTYSCDQCLPAGDDTAGTDIGDYRAIRRLGEGGMGAVHLVHHPPTARLLALKQIKDLKDTQLVKRFDREVRLLRRVVHPHVVRLLDSGIGPNKAPFLVTEFVPGGDLDHAIDAAGGRLPVSLAVPIIDRVLEGLHYLHSQQIVHRDIKPQNILLDRPMPVPERPRFHTALHDVFVPVPADAIPMPRITDFGLAKCYGRAGGTRITKAGTGLGTLMFMPPEQIKDAGDVREPADVYSAGVTLYYMLTGRYSFDFPTPNDVQEIQRQKPDLVNRPDEVLRLIMRINQIRHPFRIILENEPVPVRERDASIPETLAAVVDKAVRKDQRKRYHTVAAFSDAVRAATR